jgi:hypothetical protein
MSTDSPSDFAIAPPVEPMLAKLAEELPAGGAFLYEPKRDGFRAIVFRGGSDVFIQSRDLRPLDRYFPELHAIFLDRLPQGCVIDGEASGSDMTRMPGGGSRCAFPEEELRRRSRPGSARGRWAVPPRPVGAVGDGEVVASRSSFVWPGPGNSTLCGFEIATSRPATVRSSRSVSLAMRRL